MMGAAGVDCGSALQAGANPLDGLLDRGLAAYLEPEVARDRVDLGRVQRQATAVDRLDQRARLLDFSWQAACGLAPPEPGKSEFHGKGFSQHDNRSDRTGETDPAQPGQQPGRAYHHALQRLVAQAAAHKEPPI